MLNIGGTCARSAYKTCAEGKCVCTATEKLLTLHQFVVTEGANASSLLFVDTSTLIYMIDKQTVADIVTEALAGTDAFLVEVTVTPQDEINVVIDSDTSVDIDTCAAITRAIEQKLDRDVEDYELEVGSAGLTSPLKVLRQYQKNVGNEVEVLTRDGRKLYGILKSVSADGSMFTLTTEQKVKEPGMKRPQLRQTDEEIPVDAAKYVKYNLKFK